MPDAVSELQKSIEVGGGKDWQCFDALGAVYSKWGRADDAIQAERKAVDLAAPVQDGELVRSLRSKLAVTNKHRGSKAASGARLWRRSLGRSSSVLRRQFAVRRGGVYQNVRYFPIYCRE
ncbi:MAG: hypothetical protein WDO73_27405 [Ignavibacteriota bacterium]